MAQIVYYVTAATSLGSPDRLVSFCVPTGNFGDIFAGFAAKRLGVPVDRLVIATNVNDILDRCLRSGRYDTRGVQPSSSPSMDIQVSSNFERLLYDIHGRDANDVRRLMNSLGQSGAFTVGDRELQAIRNTFDSGAAGEALTADTIRETLGATGELLDPHTAVGYAVARRQRNTGAPMVTLATAHPAKFPDAVEKACGLRPGLPRRLGHLMTAAERFTVLPNDVGAVRDFIYARQ
jgi:threonine synthase